VLVSFQRNTTSTSKNSFELPENSFELPYILHVITKSNIYVGYTKYIRMIPI